MVGTEQQQHGAEHAGVEQQQKAEHEIRRLLWSDEFEGSVVEAADEHPGGLEETSEEGGEAFEPVTERNECGNGVGRDDEREEQRVHRNGSERGSEEVRNDRQRRAERHVRNHSEQQQHARYACETLKPSPTLQRRVASEASDESGHLLHELVLLVRIERFEDEGLVEER